MVDDDPATHCFHRLMIQKALDGVQPSVDTYSSVDQAIDGLRTHDCTVPTYILLDLNMPIKTGWDFLEEYQRIPFEGERPPVYIVSSSDNPQHIQKSQNFPDVRGFWSKFVKVSFFKQLFDPAEPQLA